MPRLRLGPAAFALAAAILVSSEVRSQDLRVPIPTLPRADQPAPEVEVESSYPPMKVDVTIKGTSSKEALLDARNRLPFKTLNGEQQAQVNAVLANNSIFRRLPQIDFDAEPDVYHWFIQNPEVAVSSWRVLKISEFQLSPAADNVWNGQAQDGSRGRIEVLHRSPNSQLILCTGEYKTPLLTRPIQATAMMHLQTQFSKTPSGENHVTHGLDLFVAFPSQTVETVVKVISPVSNMIADRNFRELSLFVRFMSVAMQKQPGWVEQMTTRLEGVTPKQKEELLNISARIFIASRKRSLREDGVQQATLKEIVAPYRAPDETR